MNYIKSSKISAAILAGGQASRLGGIAKGALIFMDPSFRGDDSERFSIIQKLIFALNQADITDIIIISNDQNAYSTYNFPLISDLRSGIGPLAGIESAMHYFQNSSDATLFLPCDMPEITKTEIVKLKESFLQKAIPIVFAQTGSHNHYLCSIARNNLLKDVSHYVDAGERRVREVWRALNAEPVFFDHKQPFLNINTPIDLTEWRSKGEQ